MNQSYDEIKNYCSDHSVTLVAVSKKKSAEEILSVYNQGQKIFGENRVQELLPKYSALPPEIEWHLVGHLQTNKVKDIVPFISLIHSIDSRKLLTEINRHAEKAGRRIDVLLQIHIAREQSKYGLAYDDANQIFSEAALRELSHIHIRGLMGMATLTEDEDQIRKEFRELKSFFDHLNRSKEGRLDILSMGMSSDYRVAIEEGSTMVRIGSAIFGERKQV